ncbi:uncharacterized protein LOC130802433 [Amaranthus tricolor]|uniref:uncharacterized protein LOC130802433 n=1 Tax=Amaranthus tricolor TaxID=29722 RepID=UPI002587223E|nr:uncharacterized protein LOC130802433 [Amaranthus tricolor]
MADESRTVITPDQSVTIGQLLQLFKQLNSNQPPTETVTNTHTLSISEKLTNQNYTKWSRLMHLAISGRDRLNHIIDDPPSTNDPSYSQWIKRDSIVISWILENIDSDLMNQYLDFPTAKALWQGIETLYSSGRDGLQIFDLTVKTNKIQQGTDTIETYYSKLIMLWKEIDRRQPNPMKDPDDIIVYSQLIQKNRLYQFLAGIHQTFDKDRRDLLLLDPLPTVEEAYASIRREILRRGIMKTEPSLNVESPGSGGVFSAKGRIYRREDDKPHLKCTHCGGTRHTKNECFKLVGYPKWWPDEKKRGERKPARFLEQNRTGQVAMGWSTEGHASIDEAERKRQERTREAMKEPDEEGTRRSKEGISLSFSNGAAVGLEGGSEEERLPLQPLNREAVGVLKRGRGSRVPLLPNQNFSSSFNVSSYFKEGWIFDCGATDTMSFDPIDFLTHDIPRKDIIKTVNGEGIKDVQTGKIIGRGIERDELYYLEEETQKGKATLVRGLEERQLWHRRLGHPSVGYLEKLFPNFVGLKPAFKCETCILAKSHKHSYSNSLNKVDVPFMLVHSDVWGPAPVKSEVFHVFVEFYNMICTQFQNQPRMLRTDNGREYINSNMDLFYKQKGLIHQTSCPNTTQQNGVAKRKNRTLLEMTRAIMLDSRVPTHLWPEAIATANYITNRLPT